MSRTAVFVVPENHNIDLKSFARKHGFKDYMVIHDPYQDVILRADLKKFDVFVFDEKTKGVPEHLQKQSFCDREFFMVKPGCDACGLMHHHKSPCELLKQQQSPCGVMKQQSVLALCHKKGKCQPKILGTSSPLKKFLSGTGAEDQPFQKKDLLHHLVKLLYKKKFASECPREKMHDHALVSYLLAHHMQECGFPLLKLMHHASPEDVQELLHRAHEQMGMAEGSGLATSRGKFVL
jgi:hypothetical protein